jgi:DNA-binding HxlR family transcriptional regulator
MPSRPGSPASPSRCPSAQTIKLVSNRWSVEILFQLGAGDVLRFSMLKLALGRITQKELTKHLRLLEANQLVAREVFPEVPPRVEYRLTDLGRSLLPPLEALGRWSIAFDAARASR